MSADSQSRRSGRPATSERNLSPTRALDAALAGEAGDPVRRALWLEDLDRRLRVSLPQPLATHARLANLGGSTLVFLVESPIWHARLRLAANDVLDVARSLGLDVDGIAIRTSTLPRPRATPAASSPLPPVRQPAIPAALTAALALLDSSTMPGEGKDHTGRD